MISLLPRVLTPIRALIAGLALFALLTPAWSLAGTTGTLSGVAVDSATNAPISGAKVTVSGPSDVEIAVTDKSGHFTFASLPPDTYRVSMDAPGYAATALNGVEISADNVLVVTLSAGKAGS
ncbi:MAG: carboxypeptidase regulatory-like domain-containing protein [Candidatus Eremiobacteraeota bacterium]|nr:carboxypeptidase regulatory-like domain-containing protein [Candidatus Eremiobacteraeota bacterium]MBV9646828.1 carboxypeptidase regulatory-like domain-containing protein [Candidatus Eremiobacteraeota bacterium]